MPGDEPPSNSAGTGDAPTVYSRQELRNQAKGNGQSHTRRYVLIGIAVVLIGVVIAFVATRGDNNKVAKLASAPPTTAAPAAGPTCPLTGAPAPEERSPPARRSA